MKTFKEFTSQTQRVNEIAPAIAVGGGAILKTLLLHYLKRQQCLVVLQQLEVC